MKKQVKQLIFLGLLGVMTVGCGQIDSPVANGVQDTSVHPLSAMEAVLATYPTQTANTEPIVPGGIMRFAESSATPMPGLLGGGVFATALVDMNMARFAGTNWSIFSSTPELSWGQDGLATFAVDLSNRAIHIQLQYQAYWHNGHPLTLGDLVFAYEVIAHPDYVGTRFNTAIQSIVGVAAYRAGEAQSISGLVLSEDEQALTIYFEYLPASHIYFGLWSVPMPRAAFEGIAVADMPTSAPVRETPIGWGPFIVEQVVAGEAVYFVRNDDFVWGAPYLDGIVTEIVHPDLIPEAMVQGLFHGALFPINQVQYYQNPSGFSYVGALSSGYNYMLFRLGYWDEENQTNVVDPTRRTADVRLRKAMAYATDEVAVTQRIWGGLRFPATSIVPPIHTAFLDRTLMGFPFNPERANELLDEAGFIQRDGQGYRKDLAGNELTLILGIQQAPNYELIAQFYMQNWADVGLRVRLWQGIHHPQAVLFEAMTQDTDGGEVDIFFGNWIPAPNPNPYSRWGGTAINNRSRFIHEDLQGVFEQMTGDEAFDPAQMRETQLAFQQLFQEHVPAIINNWRINVWAISDEVAGFSTDVHADPRSSDFNSGPWHRMGFTQ